LELSSNQIKEVRSNTNYSEFYWLCYIDRNLRGLRGKKKLTSFTMSSRNPLTLCLGPLVSLSSEMWYLEDGALLSNSRGLKFLCYMIKARAHKGGMRIGKTPKKLASICCP
jgi:hypothetical protein